MYKRVSKKNTTELIREGSGAALALPILEAACSITKNMSIGFQGKVVLVGMGKLETTINVTSMITKQASLVGSNGGTKQDIEDIFELFASGKVNPKITEIPFDEIPEGIQMLEDNKVTGRLVANME